MATGFVVFDKADDIYVGGIGRVAVVDTAAVVDDQVVGGLTVDGVDAGKTFDGRHLPAVERLEVDCTVGIERRAGARHIVAAVTGGHVGARRLVGQIGRASRRGSACS